MADRITIMAVDDIVIVDGIGKTVDCATLVAMRQRVMQWFGAYGEVEYINQHDAAPEAYMANARIDSLDFYQPYIDAWNDAPDPAPPPLRELPDLPVHPLQEQIDALAERVAALEKINAQPKAKEETP